MRGMPTEVTGADHDGSIERAEQDRIGAEDSRVLAEQQRSKRQATIDAAEQQRQIAEEMREGAEAARSAHEAERMLAEHLRQYFEKVRTDLELQRQSMEEARQVAERARIDAAEARRAADAAVERSRTLERKLDNQDRTVADLQRNFQLLQAAHNRVRKR